MPTLYWCPHQVLKATGAPEGCRLKGCLVCKALKQQMVPQLFPYLRCCGILQMDYGVKLREKDIKLLNGVGN